MASVTKESKIFIRDDDDCLRATIARNGDGDLVVWAVHPGTFVLDDLDEARLIEFLGDL